MPMPQDHLGERCFRERPVCLDAELVPTARGGALLAFWLSAGFAAVAVGLALALG